MAIGVEGIESLRGRQPIPAPSHISGLHILIITVVYPPEAGLDRRHFPVPSAGLESPAYPKAHPNSNRVYRRLNIFSSSLKLISFITGLP